MPNEVRLPASKAGYMELRGAIKDGDCDIVAVAGGISLNLGCCNEFKPKESSVQRFRCEDCKFHRDNRVKRGDRFFG